MSRPKSRTPEDLVTRLREHLRRLGLTETDERLDEYLAFADREHPSHLAWLERILGDAAGKCRAQRIERRINTCGLKVRKTLEAFDWAFQPKLERALVEQLATFGFVDRHDDVLVTGKGGTGKSHLLQSLVLKACERELVVRYARSVDLLDDLYAGLADGSYERRMKRWARPDFLVIDDVGLGKVKRQGDEPTAAHTLFDLIDRRHARVSTAVTSNLRLSAWGKYLGDATIAAAILDRLAMNAIRIDIDGPSYRQHVARQRAQAHGAPPEVGEQESVPEGHDESRKGNLMPCP